MFDKQAAEIVTSGIVGFHSRKRRLGKVHREGWETTEQREMDKLVGKSTWFKKIPAQTTPKPQETQQQQRKPTAKKGHPRPTQGTAQQPASIIFVKRTPGGELATRLKTLERELGKHFRRTIKVIERNGVQLQRVLTKSDPWSGVKCARPTCTVCRREEEKTPTCSTSNITYKNSCKICQDRGTPACYIGESSRSLRERQNEHSGDCDKGLEGSHMASHLQEAHPDTWKEIQENGGTGGWRNFKVEIVASHRSAFRRQLQEAVLINSEKGTLLNNLEEYNRCLVPTLEVKGAKTESKESKEKREERDKVREEKARQETENSEEMSNKREQEPQGAPSLPHAKRRRETKRTESRNRAPRQEEGEKPREPQRSPTEQPAPCQDTPPEPTREVPANEGRTPPKETNNTEQQVPPAVGDKSNRDTVQKTANIPEDRDRKRKRQTQSATKNTKEKTETVEETQPETNKTESKCENKKIKAAQRTQPKINTYILRKNSAKSGTQPEGVIRTTSESDKKNKPIQTNPKPKPKSRIPSARRIVGSDTKADIRQFMTYIQRKNSNTEIPGGKGRTSSSSNNDKYLKCDLVKPLGRDRLTKEEEDPVTTDNVPDHTTFDLRPPNKSMNRGTISRN